jgi:hypothetical protein
VQKQQWRAASTDQGVDADTVDDEPLGREAGEGVRS